MAKDAADRKALELNPHHDGMTFAQFKALTKPADYTNLMADLTQQLANAQESSVILGAAIPSELPIPTLEIDTYVASLSKTLDDVASDAERIVREHLSTLPVEAEPWLGDGQQFDDHKTCPYCAQSTEGLDLITAYKNVFNEKYTALKTEVDLLIWSVGVALPVDMCEAMAARVESLNETLGGWATRCSVNFLSFNKESFGAKVALVRGALVALIGSKKSDLGNYAVGPKEMSDLKASWEDVKVVVRSQNAVMAENIKTISEFKKTLETADSATIQQKIADLDTQQYRHGAAGVMLIAEVDTTKEVANIARRAKEVARASLMAVMDKTLGDYKDGTNAYLKELGVKFQIGKLSGNHRSGGRSEFTIEMRGGEVKAEGGQAHIRHYVERE